MLMQALAWLVSAVGFSVFAFGMARRRRMTPEEVLLHPARKTLWQRILRRPGLQQRDLYGEVQQPRGTVNYHLAILLRAKALEARHEWGVTRYFPAGMHPREVRQYALLLRGRVLEFVREVLAAPGVAQDQLYRTRRLSRKVLRVYVPKLVEEGLLRVERGVRTKYFHPTEELRRLVDRIDGKEPGPEGRNK